MTDDKARISPLSRSPLWELPGREAYGAARLLMQQGQRCKRPAVMSKFHRATERHVRPRGK